MLEHRSCSAVPTVLDADVASAEVAGLVHVQPDAVQGDLVVEGLQLRRPPSRCPLAQEVRPADRSRPQLQQPKRLVPIVHVRSGYTVPKD